MITTVARTLAAAALGALALACSSSSSSSSGSCGTISSTSKFSGTFTLTSGDSSCPASVPFNSNAADDAGTGGCTVTQTGSCSGSISCPDTGNGSSTVTFTASGNSVTGTATISASGLTCNYNVSGTFS